MFVYDLNFPSFILGWKGSCGRARTQRALWSACEFSVMCATSPFSMHRSPVTGPVNPSFVGPTNHILGVNNNAVILNNPHITVSSRARSYLCHTLPLTYRHTPTHFTRLRGSDLVHKMNGTDQKAGFPLSDDAFLLPSDWTPIIGTSLEGHCTKRGYRRFI